MIASRSAGAVFLLFLISGFFVYTEPAPADLLFVATCALAILGGRLFVTPAASIYVALAFSLLFLNALSGMFCQNFAFCVKSIAIRSYLLVIPFLMAHLAVSLGSAFVEKMYTAFSVSVLFSASFGILARLGVMPGPVDLYFREEAGLRLSPFFEDPNVYGPYLVTGFLLILGRTLSHQLSFRWGAMLLLIISLPVVLAFSRGAWLALGVALTTYIPLVLFFGGDASARRKAVYIMVFSVLIIAPLVALSLFIFDLNVLFERRLAFQAYDDTRFAGHAEGFLVAIHNPLGIGPGHFVGRTHFPASQFALGAHNVYLKIWVENGAAALVFFLLIQLHLLVALTKTLGQRGIRLPHQAAIISALVGSLVNGYFIDTIHWRHLFVLMGFALIEIDAARRSASGRSPRGRLLVADRQTSAP